MVIFFQEIPTDKTGNFDMIYEFLRENWNIVRWVALGIVIFEVSKNCYMIVIRKKEILFWGHESCMGPCACTHRRDFQSCPAVVCAPLTILLS